MKTSYELAMARFGGATRTYSAEQKEELADVDRLFAARIAQAKFEADARYRDAGTDAEKHTRIAADLAAELQSLEGKRERKKEELRAAFDAAPEKA
jgi:hypothetical protein